MKIYNAAGEIRPLAALEAEIITAALCHYRGDCTKAARALGIGRSTLYRKITLYRLEAQRQALKAERARRRRRGLRAG